MTITRNAERLCEIRLTLDMSQKEFAVALGIPGKYNHRQISRMECGDQVVRAVYVQAAELLLENMMLKALLGEL
jgi:transcriptional regulator with XRE-family HTH domain